MEELTYALDERRVSFVVDEDLYPKDAIYGAAYLFVDRCFVFLERPEDGKVEVRLKSKADGVETPELEALAGEFANELLNQVLRLKVSQATGKIRDYYIGRAFFGDDTRASIDALLAELDAEELDEDPLEIDVPWETEDDG